MRYDSAMRTLWIGTLLLAISSFAADRDLAGGYSGEWKSTATAYSGALRFVLENQGGTWKGTASFTLDGAEVPCTIRTVKIQDGKIELVYEFEAQGTVLRSTQTGEWKDMEFRGSYSTATADGQGIDQGTWSAKRKT